MSRSSNWSDSAILSCIGRTTCNPTSTSAENCALGIEHWSDPGSDKGNSDSRFASTTYLRTKPPSLGYRALIPSTQRLHDIQPGYRPIRVRSVDRDNLVI